MLFKDLRGRDRNVNITPYLIDWDRKVSGPQLRAKRFLHPYWQHNTVLEEFPYPGGRRSRIDLFNVSLQIVVEVSPRGSHAFNAFFDRGSTAVYRQRLKRECIKEEWCGRNGITFCELVEEDLQEGLSAALFLRRWGVVL